MDVEEEEEEEEKEKAAKGERTVLCANTSLACWLERAENIRDEVKKEKKRKKKKESLVS